MRRCGHVQGIRSLSRARLRDWDRSEGRSARTSQASGKKSATPTRLVKRMMEEVTDKDSLIGFALNSESPAIWMAAVERMHELGEADLLAYVAVASLHRDAKEAAIRYIKEPRRRG